MKKQELIHLHGLLAEVADYVEMNQDGKLNLNRYNEVGVRPTSIHRSKTDHKRAVSVLVNDITSEMETENEEKIPAAD